MRKTEYLITEYLILGDNNKWYSTCWSKKQVKEDLKKFKEDWEGNGRDYDDDEIPETLYVYKAVEIDNICLENE